MSVAGSDITDNQGEVGVPVITMRFRRLIGGMRLPSFKGDPTEQQEWILSIQKKQVVYGLSDQEIVLLTYEAPASPESKYVGGLYRENPAIIWTELKSALVRQYANECTAVEAVRKGDSEAKVDLGERIAGLAVLTFPELATRNSGPIQALLADVYMDALSDRELRGDVLREGPSTLAAAIEEARNSKRLWKKGVDPGTGPKRRIRGKLVSRGRSE